MPQLKLGSMDCLYLVGSLQGVVVLFLGGLTAVTAPHAILNSYVHVQSTVHDACTCIEVTNCLLLNNLEWHEP